MKSAIIFIFFSFVFLLDLQGMEPNSSEFSPEIPESFEEMLNSLPTISPLCFLSNTEVINLKLISLSQLMEYYQGYRSYLKGLKMSTTLNSKTNIMLAVRIITRSILQAISINLEAKKNLPEKEYLKSMKEIFLTENNKRISCRQKSNTKGVANDIYRARNKIIKTIDTYLKE